MIPTPEQQRIIDHPLTPLRVAAGAGTGKTTTIAMRLASLVLRDQIEPEAALGITFTNQAAPCKMRHPNLHGVCDSARTIRAWSSGEW